VVKRVDGKPSIMDDAVTEMGNKHGFKVGVTKDGRIFDSKEFHSYGAWCFSRRAILRLWERTASQRMSPVAKQACWTR